MELVAYSWRLWFAFSVLTSPLKMSEITAFWHEVARSTSSDERLLGFKVSQPSNVQA